MPCCASKADAGRASLGVITLVLFLGSLAYFLYELVSLETLDLPANAPTNTNVTLLWTDLAGCALGACAAFIVLMPEFCCTSGSDKRETFRRERFFAALLFFAATVLVTITSRSRDNNINTAGHNENYVCSRRDALDACPTQRVKLSQAFQLWSRANDPEDECWYNTSSSFPENFQWGEENEFSVYPTADFNDVETYERFPQYAPCYWWGCGHCVPSQAYMQERLLRFEVLVQVVSIISVILTLCLQVAHKEHLMVVRAYAFDEV